MKGKVRRTRRRGKHRLKYVNFGPISRSEFASAIRSRTPAKISLALLGVTYHDRDWRWVQEQCLHYLKHRNKWVRWNAATCLGMLAVFHSAIDVDRVRAALEEAREDKTIRAAAEDSLEDIRHMLRQKRRSK